jgi:hypothetical protein
MVYAARLTDSQCPSCSDMTDGIHTSFIMTAGGLDHEPVGRASSCQPDTRYVGLVVRSKRSVGKYQCFIASYWGFLA